MPTKEYMKEWRKNNPQRINQYQKVAKQWKKNNSEKVKQYQKKYRRNNLKKCRKEEGKYRLTLKGKYLNYKQNAKQRGLIFGITSDEFMRLINKPCHYCGGESGGIDRLDNSVGYLKDNIVSCCSMCNYMKRIYSKEDFINQCIKIANVWSS